MYSTGKNYCVYHNGVFWKYCVFRRLHSLLENIFGKIECRYMYVVQSNFPKIFSNRECSRRKTQYFQNPPL